MSPVCGTPRLRTLNTIDDVERRQLQAMYNKLQELPTERLMDIGMKWFNWVSPKTQLQTYFS